MHHVDDDERCQLEILAPHLSAIFVKVGENDLA
jgi:hypothetical protein